MKKYVTPEVIASTVSTADIITLSITPFLGLYTKNDDPIFEDNGMNI